MYRNNRDMTKRLDRKTEEPNQTIIGTCGMPNSIVHKEEINENRRETERILETRLVWRK